ncbi:MAG TPA: superoxide dismutase family protein [Woeseiaceae bacterium]|nr:superoxide dismutase family protein [Woeseiaceae bacterium]
MKTLLFALPACCLLLAACQPAEQELPEDRGTEAPAPESQNPDEAAATADGAQSTDPAQPGSEAASAPAEYAEAEILPTEGQTTGGLIKLTRTAEGVRIQGTVTGLEPGAHGFHIHEKGDCSAVDASSAGGHFNPAGNPHGSPDDPPDQHHLGDFGNITAGENGEAEVNITAPELSMSGPDSVIGKAIVVHAGRDDLKSQPSGDAGARIGCGVIRPLEVAESTTTL